MVENYVSLGLSRPFFRVLINLRTCYYFIRTRTGNPASHGANPQGVTEIEKAGENSTINPFFVEEPRMVYGPEAGDWLEQFWHPERPNYYLQLSQPPDYYRAQECSVFLLVHVKDIWPPGVLMVGDRGIQLDRIIDGELIVEPYPGVAEGAGIWIDNEPWAEDEWDSWADPNMGYRIAEDAKPRGDEFIIIFEMDALLADPGLDEVKVRVTDFHENWTRTDNVLDQQGGEYVVRDLMFRDNNRYPDDNDPCYYPNNQPPYRRVECDGYVMPRPGGTTALDVVAIVSSYHPPDSIPVDISAPTDEPVTGGGAEQVTALLYRLNKSACPSEWLEIWSDSTCAGAIYSSCVEIYCRYATGRVFYNCPEDPPMVAATDNGYTTVSSPANPVDYSETPFLYVSSSDHLIDDPGGDYKDWASAMASGVQISGSPIQDANIWHHAGMILSASYGNGFRGLYETELEQSPEWTFGGGCSIENQYYANYKDNVLTYGFELVKAECDGYEAHYAIQSQADVMFVLAHGEVFGRPAGRNMYGEWEESNTHAIPPGTDILGNPWVDQPYLFYFPESPLPPYDETGNKNDIIVWDDWPGYLGPNPDSDWLVLMACLQLGDPSTLAQCNAWLSYRHLIQNSSIRSVLGHRDLHNGGAYSVGIGNNPLHPNLFTGTWEDAFIVMFCGYLESGDYQPHPTERWLNYDPSVEYGAMCYMEAAWLYYYYYETMCGPWEEDHVFQDTTTIITASAVDLNYRYILEKVRTAGIPEDDWPVRIHVL